jgi:hypothetical protein
MDRGEKSFARSSSPLASLWDKFILIGDIARAAKAYGEYPQNYRRTKIQMNRYGSSGRSRLLGLFRGE